MVAFPFAKINLGLHILSKRTDGFHNIETCFYPIGLCDILEVIPSGDFSFTQSGLEVDGLPGDNLCVKAYHLLKKDFAFGEAQIHLHKIIPMGAGLGGGSSNAAFTLRLLNQVFELKMEKEQLKNYAAQLGSDCSFFIEDQPMIGVGRGEILNHAPVKLKGFFLVLVKPDVHSSTHEAYASIKPTANRNSIKEILKLSMQNWKKEITNDFEKTIFEKHPIIGKAKEKFYSLGATYSGMSGSGASVFGIFEKPIDLKNEFPEMFYWSGELK
ncbi:MAG: 4-(cytidine 5'-diphospho)-2-C-methyl-D-erythritol kinase [Bacteroidetes bacterium]|nr:4-(cytidine 5'-diphospho)-2-C-methyl-D-erythritol kinase [Bacteroidota bacterium]